MFKSVRGRGRVEQEGGEISTDTDSDRAVLLKWTLKRVE